MMKAKWVVFAVALGMMAATAGWLKELQGRQLLGASGVRLGQIPIYDENGSLISRESVALPVNVMGIPSELRPITVTEENTLPKDTTFGRRFYHVEGSDFGVQINVILMGTDHTSIHQPQYCLYAQDWNVTNTESIHLRMERPFAYDIPAMKLTATHSLPKSGHLIECIYVYWFVSADKITADEGSRLWSMWKTVLQKGKMERWAYISYFVTCFPGQEQATFERLEKFIRASVPEFQQVTGRRSGQLPSMAVQK